MVYRFAENLLSAYLDDEAAKFTKLAEGADKVADATTSPDQKSRCQQQARDYRKQAIDCLESAKNAAR